MLEAFNAKIPHERCPRDGSLIDEHGHCAAQGHVVRARLSSGIQLDKAEFLQYCLKDIETAVAAIKQDLEQGRDCDVTTTELLCAVQGFYLTKIGSYTHIEQYQNYRNAIWTDIEKVNNARH